MYINIFFLLLIHTLNHYLNKKHYYFSARMHENLAKNYYIKFDIRKLHFYSHKRIKVKICELMCLKQYFMHVAHWQ